MNFVAKVLKELKKFRYIGFCQTENYQFWVYTIHCIVIRKITIPVALACKFMNFELLVRLLIIRSPAKVRQNPQKF